jgi:hypothetical protein
MTYLRPQQQQEGKQRRRPRPEAQLGELSGEPASPPGTQAGQQQAPMLVCWFSQVGSLWTSYRKWIMTLTATTARSDSHAWR